MTNLQAIIWQSDHLLLLDQRAIPQAKTYAKITTLKETIDAIHTMVVRGAPAIAIAGAYGMVLYLKNQPEKPDRQTFQQAIDQLVASRPTAVNLQLALTELLTKLEPHYRTMSQNELIDFSETFANQLYNEDITTNHRMQKNGLTLFQDHSSQELHIMTYCNTGALATAGIGTALGVIRGLAQTKSAITVYASETRPYHQGSRLTAWELEQEQIPYYIIADNMAGWLMANRKIDAVIVGADRIAANGDTANKIGTYNLAIIAREHGVPFYVAAPRTSFDLQAPSGKDIPIEMRAEEEITRNSILRDRDGNMLLAKGVIAPENARALNPSFDVTGNHLITAIITELGIIKPVNQQTIKNILALFKN